MKKGYVEKRGQAAMEFLLTYGWAIMAVLVVIGALVYFDVLSPETFLSESCAVSSSIACGDYTVGDGGIQVELQNSAGRDMIVRKITFVSDAVSGDCSSGEITGLLQAGESKPFAVVDPAACGFSGSAGKNRYGIHVEYSWLDSVTFRHSDDGKLFSKMESSADIGSFGSGGYVGKGSNLSGFWKFNTEGQAEDSSPNGNDGVVSGAIWQGSGCISGGCYSFDGTGTRINMPDMDITGSFTLSAWVKPQLQPDYINVLYYKHPVSRRVFAIYISSQGKIRSSMNTHGLSSTGAIPDGEWSHIAYVFNSSASKEYIYINGLPDVSDVFSSAQWSEPFYVGYGDYSYTGGIDDVVIYSRPLSGSEISVLAGQ